VQERLQKQILKKGSMPAGSVYLDTSWYQLFANPEPPTDRDLSVLLGYRDEFNKMAEEAWIILPAAIRRRAFGATGSRGWLVVVFRTLQRAGTGAAQWTPAGAKVDGDLAKVSALTIQALIQDASDPPGPKSVAELAKWLAKRNEWFRAFSADGSGSLSLEHVQEINDQIGDLTPGAGNVLQLSAKSMLSPHLHWILFTAHQWLDERGFSGQPTWKNERIEDEQGWIRANDHLSCLLQFLRQIGRQPSPPEEPAPKRQPGTNGPEPPFWLWWNNQKLRIGRKQYNLNWRLLDFFWNRDSATFAELQGQEKPWANPVADSTISTAILRFNNGVWPPDFPWKLATENRSVVKVPQQ
jgi:hypothetical protein